MKLSVAPSYLPLMAAWLAPAVPAPPLSQPATPAPPDTWPAWLRPSERGRGTKPS